MNIKKQYDKICKAYIEIFCAKQDLDHYYHNIGYEWGVISIEDYFFYMGDICTDIDENAPKGLILEWYWEHLKRVQESKPNINYKSYVMGARFEIIDI